MAEAGFTALKRLIVRIKWTTLAVFLVVLTLYITSAWWSGIWRTRNKWEFWIEHGQIGLAWWSREEKSYVPLGLLITRHNHGLTSSFRWSTRRSRGIREIPFWVVLIVVGIPTSAMWLPRPVRWSGLRLWHWWCNMPRHRPDHCSKCGYDLTGNVGGKCPECGQIDAR